MRAATRYDFRTAARLHSLAEAVRERYRGSVAEISARHTTFPELRAALDDLPGWGPVTVGVFLRELRGVWPGARPPLDARAARAACHFGLVASIDSDRALTELARVCRAGDLDVRDLESALVRLGLSHRTDMDRCPGGHACTVLRAADH
jgi:endonuclease III